jgi:hypothetical protein
MLDAAQKPRVSFQLKLRASSSEEGCSRSAGSARKLRR